MTDYQHGRHYTISLDERCRICDRRIGIVDPFVPAQHSEGIVHVRCALEEYTGDDE